MLLWARKAAEWFKHCLIVHSNRSRVRFGDILLKNLIAFCFCLKDLPEARMQSFRLILLAEEISRQLSIDSVTWLLVLTLMKIYQEKGKLSK